MKSDLKTYSRCICLNTVTGSQFILCGKVHDGLPDDTSIKDAFNKAISTLSKYPEDYVILGIRLYVSVNPMELIEDECN